MKEQAVNIAVIGLGSNIDPAQNLQQAFLLLSSHGEVIKKSSITKTTPIGIENQPIFHNCAVLLHTSLKRIELRTSLKSIEDELKRDRTLPKFGPRTIDLDIVVWNNEVVDEDYHKRAFVKQSVNEIYTFV